MPATKIRRLVLELTEQCNNACGHCYNPYRGARGLSNGTLSRAQWGELVRKVQCEAPLSMVALSGGEPLLRPDAPEIACDLADLGLDVVVITNGVLLTPGLLSRFPADTLFEVTLLSHRAKTHDHLAGNEVFAKVLDNVVQIERHGHRWAMACVVTHLNAGDVGVAIELGIALGAQGLLLDRLNPNLRILQKASYLLPTVDDLRLALAAAEETAVHYDLGVGVAVPIPACLIDPGDYPHLHFGWCPRGNSESYFTIDCRGQLRPCNHSSLVLGDLRAESFLAMTQAEAARRLWALEPEACVSCQHPLRDECKGGCPAAHMETGLAQLDVGVAPSGNA